MFQGYVVEFLDWKDLLPFGMASFQVRAVTFMEGRQICQGNIYNE